MSYEQHSSHAPEDDDLIERRQDQGVYNGVMGEAAVHGFYLETEDAEGRPRPSATRPVRSHASHSGGRGKVEGPGGQDSSRFEANAEFWQDVKTPDEQREINTKSEGHAQLRAWRAQHEVDVKLQQAADRTKWYAEIDPDHRDTAKREGALAEAALRRKLADEHNRAS